MIVVKLGGSLMSHPALDGLLAAIVAAPVRVAIVPGGGVFADAVREAQRRLGFSDALAHRLAIDGMTAFGACLAERSPSLVATRAIGFTQAFEAGRTPIWDASETIGRSDIPESWDVTSDSLAAWLAADFDADGLILVKSASYDLKDENYTDAAFPAFASRFDGVVRFVGPDPAALSEHLAAARLSPT